MELLTEPSKDAKHRWIESTRIIVFVLGTMLLILCGYNIYNYLVKQRKYKQMMITLFYITAIVNTCLVICYSTFIVPIKDYCSWRWLWVLYGTSYFNLIIGLCQAGTLTSLVI